LAKRGNKKQLPTLAASKITTQFSHMQFWSSNSGQNRTSFKSRMPHLSEFTAAKKN